MDTSTRIPYVCTLSPETLEKAKRELNEDPNTRQQKIDDLRTKVKEKRPDIKLPPEDAFIIRFLRNKKFDIDRAFKTLEHYYDLRKKYPEIFGNFRPSAYRHIYETGMQIVVPGRDRDGRAVYVFSLRKYVGYS